MANFNLNKVIIGGRLTADPELKQTQSGTAVTTFTVAVNRRGAKDGQQQSDFISCVAWKERAELITKYFGKGSSICVEGEIQTRSWKDESGNNRYATEVNVSQVHFVDSKSENPANSAPSVIPGYTGPGQAPSFTPATPPKFEEMSKDDDLPF
jgi:single-strand DNA-binding protein